MAIKRKYWFWGVGATITLCGIGGYSGFGIPESEYNRELERAEADGLPSKPERYQRVVADRDNAAQAYREAISAWDRFNETDPDAVHSLSEGLVTIGYPLEAAERDFAKVQHILHKLDEAAAKPSLCFDHRYADGGMEIFTEFSDLKQFVKLRTFRARILVQRRNFAAAYRELEKCAAIPRQLGQENPSMITLLVQIALRSIILRSLEQTLCLQGPNPAAATNGDRVINALGATPNYREAIRGEYALALGTLAQLGDPKKRNEFISSSTMGDEIDAPHQMASEEYFIGLPSFRYQMMVPVVRFYRTAYRLIPSDPAAVPEMIKIEKSWESQFSVNRWPTDYLVRLMIFTGGITSAVAKSFAEEKLMRLLAINLSRPGGGVIPPSFPTDPYSGKPFRGKTTKDGFRIWSVGRNGVDDGGAIATSGDMSGDIVVGYPYAEKTIRFSSGTRPRAPGSPP